MNTEACRKAFETETGISWQNSQGEPDIEYVEWLEAAYNLRLSVEEIKEILKPWYHDGDRPEADQAIFDAMEAKL
jgi:hypothetical protein